MSETGVRTFEGAWGLSSGAAIGQKRTLEAEFFDLSCLLWRIKVVQFNAAIEP